MTGRARRWAVVAAVAFVLALAGIAAAILAAEEPPAAPPAAVAADEPSPVGRPEPPLGQRVADDAVWAWALVCLIGGPALLIWYDRRRRRAR